MPFDAVANGKLDTLLGEVPVLVSGAGFQVVPSAAFGIIPTSGGSAWATGAYMQITAGLGAAIYLVGVQFEPGGVTVGVDYEFDIATGASGSEVVVSTLTISCYSAAGFTVPVFSPAKVAVPASTRLSVRSRCSSAGNAFWGVKLIYVQQANFS